MRNTQAILLFLFLVLTWMPSWTQSTEVDSIKTLLEEELPDSTRSQALRTLVGILRGQDIREALHYARINRQLAEKNGDETILFKAYYTLGSTYVDNFQLDSAEITGLLALDYVRRINDPFYESFVLNLLGIVTDNLNRPDQAIEYYFQSAKISESLGDTIGMYYAYSNIGVLYYERSDLPNCIKYLQEAVDLSRTQDDPGQLAMNLLNLNNCYPAEENTELKLNLLEEAYKLAEANGRLDVLTAVCSNLGAIYQVGLKDYERALDYYRQGLRLARQVGDINRESVTQTNIGEVLIQLNQLDSAEFYLRNGLALAQEMVDYEEIYDANSHLSALYYKRGDFRRAYDYYKEAVQARDSVYLEDKNDALAEAEARYQNEKKEAEIARQELEIVRKTTINNRIIAISIAGFLLSLLLFQAYYFRQRRLKKASETALQLQQLEAQKLRELDRTKSRFFANLSHELRTPLTLILGPLKNVLQGERSREKKDLEMAYFNGQKLLNLVNEIMDLSKLESGKLQLFPSVILANDFFRRTFFAFESLAQVRGIDIGFESSLDPDLYLELDASKVEKILNNLLANALKFSATGDRVRMRVRADQERLHIEVEDTGIGIPEADLPRLFDRFFQSDRQGEQLHGGTGIGLALARELALLHGGDLRVQSQVDQGSLFTLELPLHKKKKPLSSATEKEEAGTIDNPFVPRNYQPILLNGHKAKVLVVEDNREMNAFIQQILEPFFVCHTAYDGKQALESLEKQSVDLIISDLMMPNIDGFTLRQKLSEDSRFKHLPFVMLTARSAEADKIRGFTLGIDDYISKPFSAPELIARVHNLIKNKVARQQAPALDENEQALSANQRILMQAEETVIQHLDIPEFRVEDLANALNYSPRQLGRILKKLSGFSPVEFILEIRLQKAYQLLQEQRYLSVAEVRYEIGIESASYFSRKFAERFGTAPSEILGKTEQG